MDSQRFERVRHPAGGSGKATPRPAETARALKRHSVSVQAPRVYWRQPSLPFLDLTSCVSLVPWHTRCWPAHCSLLPAFRLWPPPTSVSSKLILMPAIRPAPRSLTPVPPATRTADYAYLNRCGPAEESGIDPFPYPQIMFASATSPPHT